MSDIMLDNLDNYKPYDDVSLAAAQRAFGDSAGRPPKAMKFALSQAPALHSHDSSGSITEEDYDELKPNPYAVIPGAHGGGFEEHSILKPHLRFPKGKLSKDAQNGDYVLEAHDEDVREIMKEGLGVVSRSLTSASLTH